jgi:NDP-sugar pyrophosphorylase family protein
VRQALVNVHHRPDDVVAACRGQRGLRVRFQRERVLLGTGGAVKRAERFFAGETAVVWNGDMIFDLDLSQALAFHRRRRALATLVLRRTPDLARYGAIEVNARGKVVRLLGAPKGRPRGRALMFAGVHLLEAAFFAHLSPEPSCIVRTAYRRLVDEGAPVYGFETDARWLEVGTPGDYLSANLALLGAHALVGEGAEVGEGARLVRTVVGPGARVGEGAELRECVVWPGAEVPRGEHLARRVITAGPGPR